ncbi:hypothetical protein GTP46_04660 [Duganella sp. FT135W]|uniref:Bacteriophage abortive infection AbiH n=1 Tax=Duganella flavida TaxID=2692175 RepID=A0A6L8KBZ9_9BURK|nr:hypothetical protein [Duganella flavida]MYM21941.1 hypothetical protein [Duganella flavida]
MNDVLLIVGNGLSIDLCRYGNFYAGINTSKPLNWNFNIKQESGDLKWQDAFPQFHAYVTKNLDSFSGDNFLLFREIIENGDVRLRVEARHFLALAFAHLDQQLIIWPKWKWFVFINENIQRISGAVSFNYDSTLEKAIYNTGIPLLCINGFHDKYLSIFKPHGCNRFDMGDNTIVAGYGYPIRVLQEKNDTHSYKEVPADRTMHPRREAYTVLPHERNIFQDFSWQSHMWEEIKHRYAATKHCVVIGHSYGVVDRPEIDQIISALPLDAVVHYCNPGPCAELEAFVVESGRKWVFCGLATPEIA